MAKPTRHNEETIADYLRRGLWTPETFVHHWDNNAARYPHREALVDSRTRLTFSEAKQWIDSVALSFVQLGFKRDDVIVIQLPNCIELTLLPVACQKAGILPLPVLRNLGQKEMEYILGHVGAAGVVIPWEFRGFDYFEMIQETRLRVPCVEHVLFAGDRVPPGSLSVDKMSQSIPEKKYPEDYFDGLSLTATEVGLIRHTTGTTGFPKFAEAVIGALLYAGRNWIESCKMTDTDIGIVLAPTVGGPNASTYFAAPQAAAKLIMLDKFDAEEAFRLIEKERVTYVPAVPAMLEMMVNHPSLGRYDLSSVRCVISAGAPLSYQLERLVEERMECPVLQQYGSAEAGGVTIHSLDMPAAVRYWTVGRTVPGNEIRLTDGSGKEVAPGKVGEIWARGATITAGYYHDDEATRQAWTDDGWYRMGDLGKFDGEGNLVIVGRQKDIIIRGGQNIYPVEIENLLIDHPKVLYVAIVAMPDPVMGEKACAYVVPGPDQTLTFGEMTSFLKEQKIAAYKLPERLELVDALPMVADGLKVDKKALVQDIAQRLRDESNSAEQEFSRSRTIECM